MNQGRLSLCLLTAAGVVLAVFPLARAAEVDMDGEAEMAVNSAFVWRGQVINDEPVINPFMSLHVSGWKLSAWGSWDLTDVENRSRHSRVDVMLEYVAEWKRQMFSLGSVAYIHDDDPAGGGRDTFEAFFGYRVDVPALPSLTVHYDFGEIEGFYANVSVAHGIPLVENSVALDFGAALGVADENYADGAFTRAGLPGFEPDGASVVDLILNVELPIEIGARFTLMPGARYMRVIDSTLREALDAAGMDRDQTMWSLRGTYYF